MPANDVQELPHGSRRDKNSFGGTVRDVRKLGFGWSGIWYDQRNRNDRSMIFHVDKTTDQMTIVETGGGGNSPTQVWMGKYEANGNVYNVEGTLVQENNQNVQDRFDIYVTDLTLPS